MYKCTAKPSNFCRHPSKKIIRRVHIFVAPLKKNPRPSKFWGLLRGADKKWNVLY